ncbi:lasso peptide biosynthesis PqqD family chaperone [Alicyclobacillus ferrooxydans]|uniref:Metallophosphoesterase n=1 Tax=Alicyclobacillus ferrooxydans TaxID=471514 RepID=A0A0P9CRP1_9BACL|nr:lasso peptide biosynthesis PqqD family chaperone [Alicyclobacillus ferrooxydans]KPV39326.1 metallophosphoesterase [Alicyclobacillus ferrooxydans]
MLVNSLPLNSKVAQKPGNIVTDMDGDKVMLSIEQGKYYNLGSIGGEIWDSMKEPVQIDAIITHLLNEYEVEVSVCKEHVLTFISNLLKEELVVIED